CCAQCKRWHATRGASHAEKIRCLGLRLYLHLVSCAEESTKPRTACTQVLCRHHYHIDLKTACATLDAAQHPGVPPFPASQRSLASILMHLRHLGDLTYTGA